MSKSRKLYAAYRGEKFLDCGTAQELAEQFNTNVNNIYSKASKEQKAREKGVGFSDNTLHWYRFDYIEESQSQIEEILES